VEKTKKLHKKYYIEDDILMAHKPIGISSFALVSRMRKILNTRKIGHAGTLDPLASGLMILGINKGTKKMEKYVGLDKVYIAEIIIGKSTTTGDAEGDVVETKQIDILDMNETNLNITLQSLIGERYYLAPMYSAVKVLGKPLYKYARENKKPPFVPEKKMFLKKADIVDIYKIENEHILKFRVTVGSGTYIRTLAEEFGKKIGYPASLKSLYRVSIDKYYDSHAFHINQKNESNICDILKIYPIIKKIVCKFSFKQKK